MNKTASSPPERASLTVNGRRLRPRMSEPDGREYGNGRFAKRHGARSLARHLAAGSLDQRTWVARALRDLRLELAADAGGYEHLTARERLLIDRCAAATLICSTIEGHVFSAADRLVDDAGELLPILRRGYVSHVQSLSRMLQALGLRPDIADQARAICDRCGAMFSGPDVLRFYTAHRTTCAAAPAAEAEPVQASGDDASAGGGEGSTT